MGIISPLEIMSSIEKVTRFAKTATSWIGQFIRDIPLTDRLSEEHRQMILYRSKVACWITLPLYVVTITGYNYFVYPEVLTRSLIALLPAEIGLIFIWFRLSGRHFQKGD